MTGSGGGDGRGSPSPPPNTTPDWLRRLYEKELSCVVEDDDDPPTSWLVTDKDLEAARNYYTEYVKSAAARPMQPSQWVASNTSTLHPIWRGSPVDKDGLAKLREPFPPGVIGKLPRRSGGREIYLDYVGHAAVTARLLDVDPTWTWEPMALSPNGGPVLTYTESGQPVGLWIKMTVCGVTRIGYGSCTPGSFDAEKQLIGDAIRNAAMRFGVALDLWAKEDLSHGVTPGPPPPPASPEEKRELDDEIAKLRPSEAADLKVWWRQQGLPPIIHNDFNQNHLTFVMDQLSNYESVKERYAT